MPQIISYKFINKMKESQVYYSIKKWEKKKKEKENPVLKKFSTKKVLVFI